MTNVNGFGFLEFFGIKNYDKYIDRSTTLTGRSNKDIYYFLYANKRSRVPWLLVGFAYQLCILYLRKLLSHGISVDPQKILRILFNLLPTCQNSSKASQLARSQAHTERAPSVYIGFSRKYLSESNILIAPPTPLSETMNLSAVGL